MIPARRDAPPVEIDGSAKTVSSAEGTEFSEDNGQTWTAHDKPLNTKDYRGKTLLFRYASTKDDFASRSVTVLIADGQDAPSLIFDPSRETLNTTPDMEYSDDGGKTWKPCPEPMDVSGMGGKEIPIRYPGKGDTPPSDPISVKIPDRREALAVGHTDETVRDRKDGTLTQTENTMEYRPSDGQWIAISAKKVKNLAPGKYEVRYAATDTEMASAIQNVKIRKGSTDADDDENGGNSGNPGGTGGSGNGGSGNGNGGNGNNGGFGSSSKLSLLNRNDHFAYIVGRTSTQAAPEAEITRAEVAAILYRLLTADAKAAYGTRINHFKDVSANAWYSTAVSTLENLGVLAGYPDGTFGPEKPITRAELASILARFCNSSSTPAIDCFTDISTSWARTHINQAAVAGLIYGYEDGSFLPNRNITRAEAISMFNRILNRKTSADAVVNGYKTFSDVPAGKWFYWDIVEASNAHDFTRNGSAEKWTALR